MLFILQLNIKVPQLISPSDLELLTSFDLGSLNITLCNITSHGLLEDKSSTLRCHLDMVKVSLILIYGNYQT